MPPGRDYPAARRGPPGYSRCPRSDRRPTRRAGDRAAQREGALPTIVAHHDVTDTDHWLASPKREEFFGALGVSNIRTFVDPQNRNHVALVADVPDLDALLRRNSQTEAAAAAMDHDGVVAETVTILIEA